MQNERKRGQNLINIRMYGIGIEIALDNNDT